MPGTGGQGVSAALDCVGGEATRAITASLQPGGSTIIYGALGGPVLQMNILDVFLGKSLKVTCGPPCPCLCEGHLLARATAMMTTPSYCS